VESFPVACGKYFTKKTIVIDVVPMEVACPSTMDGQEALGFYRF